MPESFQQDSDPTCGTASITDASAAVSLDHNAKKICVLGSFTVGKTALVQRYVYSKFADIYQPSICVTISRKKLIINGDDITLVLWDLVGKNLYADMNNFYLRGADGYFLVADGKQRESLQEAIELRNIAVSILGEQAPHCLLLNKADLESEWEVNDADLEELRVQGIPFLKTSAKNGLGVEKAFYELSGAMLILSQRR
jgi:small GTP-binding protein